MDTVLRYIGTDNRLGLKTGKLYDVSIDTTAQRGFIAVTFEANKYAYGTILYNNLIGLNREWEEVE